MADELEMKEEKRTVMFELWSNVIGSTIAFKNYQNEMAILKIRFYQITFTAK